MSVIETTRISATEADSVTAALRKRYGEQLPDIGSGWNDILAQLLAHRSTRSYRPDPVPPHIVETLVAAAQSAPSSSNLQTWSVVVVEDQARKERLAEFAGNQKHIREAPLFLVWLADLSRAERLAELEARPDEGIHFIETLLIAVVDAALAAQNAVVALESLGLGSVYIGAATLGHGIIQPSRFMVADLNAQGALKEILTGYTSPGTPLSVLYAHRHNLSSRLRAFIEWVTELARNNPDLHMPEH